MNIYIEDDSTYQMIDLTLHWLAGKILFDYFSNRIDTYSNQKNNRRIFLNIFELILSVLQIPDPQQANRLVEWWKKNYSNQCGIEIPPTDSSFDLVQFAMKLTDKIFKDGFDYSKAGVMLLQIQPKKLAHATLFAMFDAKHDSIMATMDKLNERYGRHTLRLGAVGTDDMFSYRGTPHSRNYPAAFGKGCEDCNSVKYALNL